MDYQILQGDNRETLKTLEDCSVDAIVTDPPYGIDFLGKSWDANTGALETYQECLRVLKPGGYILAFSAARTYHHLAITLERAGFEIRDQLMWLYSSGFPKAQDIGKAIDKRAGKKDPNYGTTKQNITSTEGKGHAGQICNVCQRGVGEWSLKCTNNPCGLKYNYQTDQGRDWAGWKTSLKPAHEPICMARKPFKGSTIDNVLEHGVGALNIDASRIEYESLKDMEGAGLNWNKTGYETGGPRFIGSGDENKSIPKPEEKGTFPGTRINTQGRFPSNVIGEVEGYQKFFYCPKVSRKERHIGFENAPTIQSMLEEPKRKHGYTQDGTLGRMKDAMHNSPNVGNNHPTVKPVALMRYLIQLVTPPNSTVLDPFNGSGSTGMAAVELGHEFIGCELDPAYVAIAEKRIRAWNTPEPSGTTFEVLFEQNG